MKKISLPKDKWHWMNEARVYSGTEIGIKIDGILMSIKHIAESGKYITFINGKRVFETTFFNLADKYGSGKL